jgi:hypothetical protein
MAATPPPLTYEYLQKYMLGYKEYSILTSNNDDSIADDKLNRAQGWAEQKFFKAGKTIDLTEFYTASAIVNYACYLLYRRNKQAQSAKEYQEAAQEDLKTVLGADALGEGDEDMPTRAGMSVAKTISGNQIFTDEYGCGGYGPDREY